MKRINQSNTFPKSQKLTARKDIHALFSKSAKSFHVDCMQVRWIQAFESKEQSKYLLVVPKRKIGKAVVRNYLKRCMREGVRKNKASLEILLQNNNEHLHIALIYQKNYPLQSNEIEQMVEKGFKHIWNEIAKIA